MAKTIFYQLPAHGHVNPSLPLVAELVRRGDEVIYYATEPFRAAIERHGASFRDYGPAMAALAASGGGGQPFNVMAASMAWCHEHLPALLRELKAEAPDYLLLDSMALWGTLVQQLTGLPAITACTMFLVTDELMGELRRPGTLRPPLAGMLAGLPALLRYHWLGWRLDRRWGTRHPGVGDYFRNPQAMTLLFTSRDLQPYGETLGEAIRFVGPSIAPRAESADFPWHELGEAPLLYISLGTLFNEAIPFYRACFAAFGGLPVRVLLSIGQRVTVDQVGTPPANFLVRPHVPQLEVLARAALFVTHGGMNSASEALLEGVPMLVVPQAGDQFFVANRLHALGAALALDPRAVTPERLRAHAERLLHDPTFRQRSQQLGAGLRAAGGYRRAADEVAAFKAVHAIG